MTQLLLASVPLWPLFIALFSPLVRHRIIVALAPLPGLLAALLLPLNTSLSIPWLLLGVQWQFDEMTRVFLLFSSVVWLASACFLVGKTESDNNSRLFNPLFLMAMSGNMLLIVSADMISFYIGFAIMGLSAYGLLLKKSQTTRRAARVYLGFTLAGEFALFSGILLLAASTETLLFNELSAKAVPDIAVLLLILGFGIKLALPGLHLWLPLVYSSAPLVAVAVLSGPMMKAGLLGWLRFLPVGTDEFVIWGELLMILGSAGLVMGTVLSLLQSRPASILAYSSIAKMGFISLLFGHALCTPEYAGLTVSALVLFAMHHMLVKSMLFLGLSIYQRSYSFVFLISMAVLAFSLAALPWTGGAAAKDGIKQALAGSLDGLLLLASISAALMMAQLIHRLWLMRKTAKPSSSSSPGYIGASTWWLMLPLAVWAPFMPFEIDFTLTGLVLFTLAGLLVALRHMLGADTPELPDWLKTGDLFHLIKRVSLRNPLRYRSRRTQKAHQLDPVESSTNCSEPDAPDSLVKPAAKWLLVIMVLLAILFIPIITPMETLK